MAYLIPTDYQRLIQDANLSQILTNNPQVQQGAELAAVAEAQSYLKAKYDVSAEFKDVTAWDKTKVYQVGQRVYLDAPAYNPASTYNTGALTLQSGNVYKANQNGITGVFDVSKWTLLGARYAVFFVKLPYPAFSLYTAYNKGDIVYYAGRTYQALQASVLTSHDAAIQYTDIKQIPFINQLPTSTLCWKDLGAYSVAANTDILDNKWQSGDNRDSQMVMYCVDIALYHIHSRIAPNNIPELRHKRYEAAIDWLHMCAEGKVTPSLPIIEPKRGGRIRFGGEPRKINSY